MSHTELTGAFLEIVEVTDPDGTPSKTVLSFTTDDVELTIDEDEASTEKHSDRRRIRRRTYNEATIAVTSLIEPTLETLDTTGIIDAASDGAINWDATSRTWDACFVRVYEDEGDTDPKIVHRLDEVEWHIPDGVTHPSDFSTAGLEGWIHGDIKLDYTEA